MATGTSGGAETAEFIHDLRPGDIPAGALHMARRCLLDTIAIWAGGSATEASRIACAHAARRYPGALRMPFDGREVNPVGYAFAGAASIDALDGHDGHQLCKGHASVALVPALMAELGAADCGLDDLLCHLIVGEEIAIRAGLTLHATAPDYHSSGAWNGIGAAAIAARLRGLDRGQTLHALGIAEYYGPRAPMMRCIAHPTMVKDSSSWGALVGVSAADLAEDGFTGAPAETLAAGAAWADLGRRWRILETNFKAYPNCRWAHPAVEALLSLTRAEDVAADDIAAIEVTSFAEALALDTRRPADTDAAQYSLPVALAIAAQHGTIRPEHLEPAVFDRPETRRLIDLVAFKGSAAFDAAFPAERFAAVTLRLADGRELRSGPHQARGNFDSALSDGELLAKLKTYRPDTFPPGGIDVVAGLLEGASPNWHALREAVLPRAGD